MTMGTSEPRWSYTIASGDEGKRRLNLLAEIMLPTTRRVLDDAGLRRGDQCLDLGCGGGHVTLHIARIVGPQGRVTGVDFDPQILELARRDATDAGLANVEYHVAACSGLP
jgi:ubiquinone/menaquinone biosynthesis C-methylase UbiE